ncbi:rod shape-determining protein MreC [Phormidium yuhuli AB48]|uniref:Cell shape-determining protein MreC n=1 Tax=Phormidium yuhuli AB48 TaxID=2940671 RepID=A0ABY5AN62_9CYAN|nr:rod shape-determining protein MreC [Phormidium yuhuli]USR90277.1 rod shape-determining protein MreC [Phormidium yuhuli AB48]
MYVLRRCWQRYRTLGLLATLAIGSAWVFRQTDGAIVFELYQRVSLPFQTDEVREQELVNARVLELQQRLVEVNQENLQLRELLSYEPQAQPEPTFAPVIGRSADRWWQQILLGRGRKSGLAVDDIVMAPGGIVGRIVSVTDETSRVLLISDPSSSLGVTVGRSREMGVLRGKGSDRAVVEFFEKVPDVEEGDAILSSPYSQRFTSGLPIGTVVAVNLNASPAPQVEIEISAPLSSLEWVMVYPKPSVPLPTESAEPIDPLGENLQID